MESDDPYAPPSSEIREELPPRRYGHVIAGSLLACAACVILLVSLQADMGLRSQSLVIGATLLVGILLLQFRQMGWKMVVLIVPPSTLVALIGLAYAIEMIF